MPKTERIAAPGMAARAAMGDHFRDGAAMIRQPFCVYDADERLVAYNQAFANLHLLPDGTYLLYPGIAFQEIMEWRQETGFFADAQRDEGLSTPHDYKLRLGDVIYQLADRRWIFVDNTPLPDGRLACIWSDITAVKEAERQLWELTRSLHRSHDHLYAAQRVAHVGSIERDLRTGAVAWTPEMYQIFDRDPAQSPPTRDEAPKLFHPEDRARYRAVMAAAEEGVLAPPTELRVVRPDGRIRWVHHEFDVVRDDDGKPWLRVGTFRDVTEIHEYQERQAALQEELLARERLSAMGSVTAKVARDLRDPLSTIKNSVFLVRSEALNETPAGARALERIERSADRCNRIISDLIEYSYSSLLRRRAHVLDDWLREMAETVCSETRLPLKLDLRAWALVELDPGRLRRALSNIVDNATQAFADSGDLGRAPRIVLRSRMRGGNVEIDIADNGPGIAPEILARAFEPLFSTRRYGTGLGLATTRQIVEQHGGTIELTSRIGKGTRARILLPLAEAEASNSRLPTAA
ncbi:MAG TPA: ATP-binding protein [Stellaceae bacterium]|nr:ATP-binding protein [Stellaceae bacterium]